MKYLKGGKTLFRKSENLIIGKTGEREKRRMVERIVKQVIGKTKKLRGANGNSENIDFEHTKNANIRRNLTNKNFQIFNLEKLIK